MFSLSDFYGYCKMNDVYVFPFNSLPQAACTARDQGYYAVALNFSKLKTTRSMRTAMMHESGHLHTGALHKVYSPFQIVAQNEYRADADSFRRYLPADELREAMRQGYTEPWQLAEYFDLDEDYIKKALHYWTECRAIDLDVEKENEG